MKQTKNIPGIIIYAVSILLYLVTIFTGYREVSNSLDGWHNFSKGHAMIFVFVCLVLAGGCIHNIKIFLREKGNKSTIIIGMLLIIVPLLFHIFAVGLQGNADSDFKYLLLRTFQGFDHTYIFLIISAIVGFCFLIYYNAKK